MAEISADGFFDGDRGVARREYIVVIVGTRERERHVYFHTTRVRGFEEFGRLAIAWDTYISRTRLQVTSVFVFYTSIFIKITA